MSRQNYIFTSESVSEGHPDKVCDRISDAVLDAFLTEEPEARVAAETFATTNRVVIGGEVGLGSRCGDLYGWARCGGWFLRGRRSGLLTPHSGQHEQAGLELVGPVHLQSPVSADPSI